jgi:hypothetical protein
MNTAKQQANLRQEQHIWHRQEGIQLALKFEQLYTHYMAVRPSQDIQQGSVASFQLISDTRAIVFVENLTLISKNNLKNKFK